MLSRFVYLLALGHVVVLALLPLRWALAFGRLGGNFLFYVLKIRRDVAVRNVGHVLGETRTAAEVEAVAAEGYRQFGMTLVETLRSAAPFRSDLTPNVTFDGLEPIERLRDSKKPVICVQAHTGNFDLAAYAFAAQGFPHHTVMRTIKNPWINRMIMGVREKHGVTVHEKGPATTGEVRALLARGEWLGILPDQNAKERGVTVDFLGKPASLYKGAASFHLETGAPLVVAVDERSSDEPWRHHVTFEVLPPITPTGDVEEDVRAVMQAVADSLGARILKHPAQYFWMHRLWGKAMHLEASVTACGQGSPQETDVALLAGQDAGSKGILAPEK